MFDAFSGGLPQFGQMGGGLVGPDDFSGGMMPFGDGMFGQPQKKKKGFNPLMMMSPLGFLAAQHPKAALTAMSPAFGLANLLGAFK